MSRSRISSRCAEASHQRLRAKPSLASSVYFSVYLIGDVTFDCALTTTGDCALLEFGAHTRIQGISNGPNPSRDPMDVAFKLTLHVHVNERKYCLK